MPKHSRQCNFCTNTTTSNPGILIFSANEHLKSLLNVKTGLDTYICEEHFELSDIKPHGTTKRLCDGAVPVFFPRKQALLKDHDYVRTAPLDLVSLEVNLTCLFKCYNKYTGSFVKKN